MMQQILAKRVKVGDRIVGRWGQQGEMTIVGIDFETGGQDTGDIYAIDGHGKTHMLFVSARTLVDVVALAPRTPLEELEMVWDRFARVELGQLDGYDTWEGAQSATIQDLYNAVLKVMNTPPEVE